MRTGKLLTLFLLAVAGVVRAEVYCKQTWDANIATCMDVQVNDESYRHYLTEAGYTKIKASLDLKRLKDANDAERPTPNVEWVGLLPSVHPRGGEAWFPDIEMGLGDDGLIHWRKRPTDSRY